ncbi:MAG: DUF4239 domain-containing protein [Candidatus Obscuribacterales bacterium]|nr:DUF4239 domain-containing protein [Candidatus Obscuribacterales bacterium]
MEGIPSIFSLSAVAAILAAVGFFVVQRFVKPIDMETHQGFLDAMLSIVGTLVSILLGLLVAAALEDYEALEVSVDKEAASVAHVFRITAGLPAETRDRIQGVCMTYCEQVVNDDWPIMEKGKIPHESFFTLSKLVNEAAIFEPKTEGQNNLHAELLSAVSDIVDYRRDRMLVLHSNRQQNLMPVLLMCSIIVLVFAYLYTRRGTIFHGVLISMVAIALGANLGLVYVLTNPFKADWKIQPRGFILNKKALEQLRSRPELMKLYHLKSDAPAPSSSVSEPAPTGKKQ